MPMMIIIIYLGQKVERFLKPKNILLIITQ